ncbi:MAG: hypothetical protein LBI42_09765 [Chitinispirillales bacterium]|nr:hypothetical protein [Chitinispirillales bacterium]
MANRIGKNEFETVREWIKEAGFKIFQDEKNKKYNQYQIIHPEYRAVNTYEEQILINLINGIVTNCENIKEQLTTKFIRDLFTINK